MKVRQIKNENLSKIGKAAADNGGSIRIVNEPYMRLCAEWIGHVVIDKYTFPALSVCHYEELNGDLMRDPDIVYARVYRSGDEYWIPYSYRCDYTGTYQEFITSTTIHRSEQYDCALFTLEWMKNLQAQGFIDLLDPEHVKAVQEFETEVNA